MRYFLAITLLAILAVACKKKTDPATYTAVYEVKCPPQSTLLVDYAVNGFMQTYDSRHEKVDGWHFEFETISGTTLYIKAMSLNPARGDSNWVSVTARCKHYDHTETAGGYNAYDSLRAVVY